MTRFYLVRHGQIERNHGEWHVDPADPPLSQQGRMQAAHVSDYLRHRAIARLYASPLRRAQETAAPLAAMLHLPLRIDARLRERMNFGDLPGQSLEDFHAMWERASRERDSVPPVGDSSRCAGERIEHFIRDVHVELVPGELVNEQGSSGEVVAFTHGGIIADFLLNVCTVAQLEALSPAFVAQPYSGEIMRNGAITVVEYDPAGERSFSVTAIALTAHLSPQP
jgi:broad specificity phosphatase PhoE